MASPTSPAFPADTPAPGDLTVPLTSGWQAVAAGVLLLLVAAVVVLAVAAARTGASERSDWQAWLAARPSRRTGAADAWSSPSGTAPAPTAPAGADAVPGPVAGP
jgi:hypothetical protein